MIATQTQIKAYLNITTTTYDAQITAVLAQGAEKAFLEYLNNNFLHYKVTYSSSTIVFDADNDKITDTNAEFVTDHFIVGYIYVDGSYHNDGYHNVSVVAETELTIATTPVAEDTGEGMDIYLVKFPLMLTGLFAECVGEILFKEKGIKSESIGSHSVTFMDGISKELKEKLNVYKRVYK